MDESHERRADELEREIDRLEKHDERLGREISEVRDDWESKKSSEQVPGAVEREGAAPGGLGDEEDDDREGQEERSGDSD